MANLPWVFGGVVAGGILHIVCVFSIPRLAERDAWTLLSANVKPNTLVVADEKNQIRLPFTPPEVISAYCLFDLSQRNIIVTTPLREESWSLAVSTPSGENFYLATGLDAKKPEVRLLIIRRDRLSDEASTEKTDEGDDQNIIVSPGRTGIVAIRAPLRSESFRAEITDALRKARCEVQKSFEPVVASVSEPPITQRPVTGFDGRRRYRRRRWR
jgi:uncharacterized membrane protein